MVAIDLGVARFATLSDGTFIEAIHAFRPAEAQLAQAQRRMNRKTKYSSNWKKAQAKVGSIQARIARIRQDFLHQTSTQISKSLAIVCVEDLKVRNMPASAAGTVAQPGTNVRAKAGLNKAILDQGWACSCASSRTSWIGAAGCWSKSTRATPAAAAPSATTWTRRTAGARRASRACRAGTRRTRTTSRRSTF
jgi:Probable transposase